MPTLSHVNQEREISISLFFAVKSRFDAPVFMPRVRHGNVITRLLRFQEGNAKRVVDRETSNVFETFEV